MYVSVGTNVEQGTRLAELDVKNQEVMVSEASRQKELAGQERRNATQSIPSELSEQIIANQKMLADIGRNVKQQQGILDAQTKNLRAYKQLETKGYLSSVELMEYQEKAVELQNSIGQSQS
jgi:multidrug resistance efflux pump